MFDMIFHELHNKQFDRCVTSCLCCCFFPSCLATRGRTTRLSSAVSAAASGASTTATSEAMPTAPWSASRLDKVTMKRGTESFPESFAPIDFQFTAPENVASFSFNKPSTSGEIRPADGNLESSGNGRDSTSASSTYGRSSKKSRRMRRASCRNLV